jgi:hypothetical protein
MAKEFIIGIMVRSTTVSGKRASNTDTEFGKDEKESHTLVNGRTLKQMAMECIHGRTEIDTRENGNSV